MANYSKLRAATVAVDANIQTGASVAASLKIDGTNYNLAVSDVKVDNVSVVNNTVANIPLAERLAPVSAAVATEKSAREAAITDEAEKRKTAEATAKAYASTLVTNEATRAQAAESTITNNLLTEKTRAQTAETTEKTRAQAAEKVLSDSVGTPDDAASSAGTVYARIKAEAATRAATDTSLTAGLETEQSTRAAADTALFTAVNTEKTRAQTAEATLSGTLTAETNARTAADSALSARIDNLASRGRFLSTWSCITGRPETFPTVPEGASYPYIYTFKSGDYFIIDAVGTSNNLRPKTAATSMKKPSATDPWELETMAVPTTEASVKAGDFYHFDGEVWLWQVNTEKTVAFAQITGDPRSNNNLNDDFVEVETSIGTKQDKLVSGTNIKTINGQSLLTSGNIELTKTSLGLGNVDNTSDADKPISTLTQSALAGKVDKISGKGLSTNDYTTAEKTKLSSIPSTVSSLSIDTADSHCLVID